MKMRQVVSLAAAMAAASMALGCMSRGWQPSFERSSYQIMISSDAERIPTVTGPDGVPMGEGAVQSEVDRLLALRPKAAVPARVLLYQVPSSGPTNIASPLKVLELREATAQQMKKDLEGAGVFSSVDFLPDVLLPPHNPADLRAVRIAAARAQADGVLVYSTEAGFESKPNAWALLYATIVGAFIVPGTDDTSMAVSKAVLLDVATGYIYLVTEDYGAESERGSAAGLDAEKLEYDARLKSLAGLSANVAGRAKALRE